MSDVRLGARLRVVRHRLRWRQQDVADLAGVSQDTVSRIERGHLDALQLRTIRAVMRALEMDLVLEARWRGGDLDRVADAGHAALVGRIAARLEAAGWQVRPEVSFAVYGERGSIDLLAWHAGARILLVVEVKTTLNSVEETLRRHDTKVRLAPAIAIERFGWQAAGVARLLVLPDLSVARRRVAANADVLGAAYPLRGRTIASWLTSPTKGLGMLLLPVTLPGRGGQQPVNVRRVRRMVGTPPSTAAASPAGPVRPGSVRDSKRPAATR